MSSLIFAFVVNHWEDILIGFGVTFAVGLIFYITNGKRIIEYLETASGIDFIIFFTVFIMNFLTILLVVVYAFDLDAGMGWLAFIGVGGVLIIDALVLSELIKIKTPPGK